MDGFSGFFVDEKAVRVENIFLEFLKKFKFDPNAVDPFYDSEIEAMKSKESTTMYVDFSHVMHFNDILQKAISEEYLRFEPYLRNACKRFVMEHKSGENRAAIISDENPNRDINVAFYKIPLLKRLRDLTTSEIGKLTSVMGVVTRTSEVRPELLQGSFKCMECRGIIKNVEQLYKYTEIKGKVGSATISHWIKFPWVRSSFGLHREVSRASKRRMGRFLGLVVTCPHSTTLRPSCPLSFHKHQPPSPTHSNERTILGDLLGPANVSWSYIPYDPSSC